VLRGIEKVCDEAHMGMIVSSTHQDKKKQKNVLRLLKSQGVDGLIIAPIDVLSHEYAEFGSILGTVAIGETHAVRAVGSDGKEGAFAAALHLLELGHKEIGLVNGRDFVSWCRARREGVVEAFEKFGYSPKECLHTYVVDDMTTHEGERAAKHLLEESNRATGIICANDMLALGVLLESRRRGVSVPDELSIVGYDDVDFSSALNPALTTVRQPSYELGKRVAHVLLGEEEDSTTILDTNLVVRDSTAPPQTKCNSQ
jgi:LacI family transcriptional regulator